jgi:hypothetical protein
MNKHILIDTRANTNTNTVWEQQMLLRVHNQHTRNISQNLPNFPPHLIPNTQNKTEL